MSGSLVNDIVAKTQVAQPTVSHHLAILREAGLGLCSRGAAFNMLNQEKVIARRGRLISVFAPGQSLIPIEMVKKPVARRWSATASFCA